MQEDLKKKGDFKMTVLFGTVEYFEREIINYLNDSRLKGRSDVLLSDITSKLEYEILYDFMCHERLRSECLSNLRYAIDLLSQSKELVVS
jgi:hypothetical protein